MHVSPSIAPCLPAAGTVDVWSVPLEEAWLPKARRWLNEEERTRADRFRVELPRLEWTVSRAALRCLLGRALGLDPREVVFVEGERGKPALDGESGLHFNLTHTTGRALVGVCIDGPLGIDLEAWSRAPRMAGLAEAICAPEELERIDGQPDHERNPFLLRLWTAKEAYLKAIGLGLGLAPTKVRLVWQPDGTARVGRGLGGESDDRFLIRPVRETDADGYVGHVAVGRPASRILVRQFTDLMIS